MVATQEQPQILNKETQKIVLKTLCEFPATSIEELASLLQSRGKKLSQEELNQAVYSISPTKNWQKASEEEIQEEILNYVWTLENQILFLFPAKQKETSVAEFNHVRLQNKQCKAQKDIIRHLQTLLHVESKNLGKFRKFQKELTLQNDVDANTHAIWAVRLALASVSLNQISNINELSSILIEKVKEKYPTTAENVGKTLQRITEKLVEKYFPKGISDNKLKELISLYQSTFNKNKQLSEGELNTPQESQDQNKLIKSIKDKLNKAKEELNQTSEGGFLSKLFSGKVKNREGIIEKLTEVIESLDELNDQESKASRSINEKVLIVQKLQSDYEAILIVKSQIENESALLNDKLITSENKSTNLTKELTLNTESLEKAHEKIASLQQKIDELSSLPEKADSLKEELNSAKSIAISLHTRISKLKSEVLRQEKTQEKSKA